MKKLIAVMILCLSFFACEELEEMDRKQKQEEKQTKIDLQTMGNRLQITYVGERSKIKFFIIKDTKTGREFIIAKNEEDRPLTITPIIETNERERSY